MYNLHEMILIKKTQKKGCIIHKIDDSGDNKDWYIIEFEDNSTEHYWEDEIEKIIKN